MTFRVPNESRIRTGRLATSDEAGNNGAFQLMRPAKKRSVLIYCIASDGWGWEHVSVSLPGRNRLPGWEEMSWVKNQFWSPEDAVMQLHPPDEDYVDMAEVLHLWRPVNCEIPLPKPLQVGLKGFRIKGGTLQ